MKQEVSNHNAFSKARVQGYDEGKVPEWLKIPYITQTKKIFSMEKVNGISLKRLAFLKIERLRLKLGPFSEEGIREISEREFQKLLEKRNIFEILPTAQKAAIGNDFIPPVIFEVFPLGTRLGEKFRELEAALKYLKEQKGIRHTDLHWDNILINEETEDVYIIDFGKIWERNDF